MDPLNDRARGVLDAYKASISPSVRESRDAWNEIASRVKAPEVAERRSNARLRSVAWGVAFVGVAAAAVVFAVVGPDTLRSDVDAERSELGVDLRDASSNPQRTVSPTARGRSRAGNGPDPSSVERGIEDHGLGAPEEAPLEPGSELRDGARLDAASEGEAHALPATLLDDPAPEARAQPNERAAQAKRSRAQRSTRANERDADSERSRATGAADASSAEAVTTLAAERELLERARAALLGDDPERTLVLARRYIRDFPEGVMTEEIEVLRIRALCAAGRESEWSAARRQFERLHPGSPLRAHLDEDCRP